MSSPASEVDVGYVAQLARLELTEEEQQRLQHDIDGILGYVRQLQEVNVDDVEPTAHATAISNVFRPDAAADSLPHETAMANAPATIELDLIRVPVVLPGEEGG